MGLYHHCIFPYLLDLAMGSRVLVRPRQRTLARATGRILEIGFGTGRNLPHYPPDVRRIEAIDPDVDLDRFSQPRIAAAGIDVDFHHLNAEHLPFEGDRFDTVVCTLTLCSIPDVVHALGEVRACPQAGRAFSLPRARPRRRTRAWPAGSGDSIRCSSESPAVVT